MEKILLPDIPIFYFYSLSEDLGPKCFLDLFDIGSHNNFMNSRARKIMKKEEISHIIKDIARSIKEQHPDLSQIVIVGIKTRGVPLAQRLIKELFNLSQAKPYFGALDIAFYRDDLSRKYPFPEVKGTDLEVSIDGKTVILVDDVIYTGRTIRAAMDELLDYGRPNRIELAVIVDRGQRELPICPDYVGKTFETDANQMVEVRLEPIDEEDAVYLIEGIKRREKI